jgi:hypothetical protein
MKTIMVRESETILLSGQGIPAGDYIHVYDASPYKIMNGHLATKIPCDQSFQATVDILVGQAPKLQSIQLHLIEELSTAGKLRIYRADLEPSSKSSTYYTRCRNRTITRHSHSKSYPRSNTISSNDEPSDWSKRYRTWGWRNRTLSDNGGVI